MKKTGIFITFLLLISLLFSFVFSVSAQEAAPGLDQVPLVNEIQAGQQQYEQYTTAQNKSDYLKQEWAKILEKHKIIGPIFKVINSAFVALGPFFNKVLGYSSLSWAFIFAISFWLYLFFIINPIASQLLKNNLIGGIASFVIVSLVGLSGAIKGVVEFFNSLITATWMLWVAIAVVVILLFVFSMFGKQIKRWLRQQKLKAEQEKTEKAQKTIQAAGKVAAAGPELD